jgi:predicted ABC-type ATPase
MDSAEKPRLIVVAGPNGAGKTAITEQLLRHEWMGGCEYINPDFIAHEEFGDWNDPEIVLKAARLATERRERCLVERRSLAFETVLSMPDKVEFICRARAKGFFVRLFFVGTDDPSINAKRVAMRVMQGGHDVPISKIIKRHSRSLASCALAARVSDRAYVYDNSVEEVLARLLFRTVDGYLEKTYGDLNPWAREILNQIEVDR